MNKEIKIGVWKHYKGNYYEVIDVARHSEDLENLVVYRSLYGEFDLWVRPLDMFLEDIEISGVKQPRFEFIENKSASEFEDPSALVN